MFYSLLPTIYGLQAPAVAVKLVPTKYQQYLVPAELYPSHCNLPPEIVEEALAVKGPIPRLPLKVVVAMPTLPLFNIVNAGGVLVAYASVEVPMYKFPPIEEKSQCLRLAAAE